MFKSHGVLNVYWYTCLFVNPITYILVPSGLNANCRGLSSWGKTLKEIPSYVAIVMFQPNDVTGPKEKIATWSLSDKLFINVIWFGPVTLKVIDSNCNTPLTKTWIPAFPGLPENFEVEIVVLNIFWPVVAVNNSYSGAEDVCGWFTQLVPSYTNTSLTVGLVMFDCCPSHKSASSPLDGPCGSTLITLPTRLIFVPPVNTPVEPTCDQLIGSVFKIISPSNPVAVPPNIIQLEPWLAVPNSTNV